MCTGKQMETIVETIEDKNFSTCNSFMSFYGTIHTNISTHTKSHHNTWQQSRTTKNFRTLVATPYCISFNDKYIVFLLFISEVRDVSTRIRLTMTYTYPFFTKRRR